MLVVAGAAAVAIASHTNGFVFGCHCHLLLAFLVPKRRRRAGNLRSASHLLRRNAISRLQVGRMLAKVSVRINVDMAPFISLFHVKSRERRDERQLRSEVGSVK